MCHAKHRRVEREKASCLDEVSGRLPHDPQKKTKGKERQQEEWRVHIWMPEGKEKQQEE